MIVDPKSRFFQMHFQGFQERLAVDRAELDLWAVMMLAASFEALVRIDMSSRVRSRTKDAIRRPFRALEEKFKGRVRFEDLIEVWENEVTVGATVRHEVRRLLFGHRHWLAHGRYWTNKLGRLPSPNEAHASFSDYVADIQAKMADFPLP